LCNKLKLGGFIARVHIRVILFIVPHNKKNYRSWEKKYKEKKKKVIYFLVLINILYLNIMDIFDLI